MSEDRRSIDDLIARYELEPSLNDIFVEGFFDKEILELHARENINKDITFYEIDTVDINFEILKKYSLTEGNKQRAIALSKELNILPHEANVFCLVDKDLDHFFEDLKDTKRLKWSLYCSIEGHYLNSKLLNDIVFVTARAKIKDQNDYIQSLEIVLKKLYALRLCDRQLALNLNWVALKKYLNKKGDQIEFEHLRYIKSLLNSNNKMSSLNEFNRIYTQWFENINCDIRNCARGHDYTEMLAWSIDNFGGQKEFSTAAAVERLFVLLARSITSLSNEIVRDSIAEAN